MDWNYIAGFFDGEGNITIHKPNERGATKYVAISVAQKESKADVIYIMKEFLEKEGIETHLYLQKTQGEKWENMVALRIANKKNGEKFLKKIIGKLYVKKSEAEKALEFYTTFKRNINDITEEEGREIIELYMSGKSCEKISKIFGVSKTTIYTFLRSQSNYREIRQKFFTSWGYEQENISEETRKLIVESYIEGKSVKEVATIVNISPERVRYLLIKKELIRKPIQTRQLQKKNKIEQFGDALIDDYNKGISTAQLYEKYGRELKIGQHSICNYLRERGILRNRGEARWVNRDKAL